MCLIVKFVFYVHLWNQLIFLFFYIADGWTLYSLITTLILFVPSSNYTIKDYSYRIGTKTSSVVAFAFRGTGFDCDNDLLNVYKGVDIEEESIIYSRWLKY